ncbi:MULTISPECIES: SLC13 family permease [Rhodanobacter]|uniref:Di-/tricarboxylate transporter n=1 Tax=Rhodanobacter denitrificans TaxID=666685 RepID=I4WVU0_9GAMM|nr:MULTISPECIES: SLC13 family permease [Rhodanobacter]AGG90380.1 di-/tricarboxylate transporter [Rhodanobacter denitrificans]EIM03582.1 Di- and tricarboxylate transporter [Rhodanobacter denitrificans]UJJ50476.1 SLC13 family permease [Rhodanobacter denitrificans]UJJ57339.1 SLC13 family permease [Rhodanobacter denitrificans]UJM85767.1 SLC13 family permease [Rhodanobacter denitrificans]
MALSLTPEMILVLGLVGFTMLMLVLEWIRADMVALLVVVVIGLTGLIPSDRVFNGFAGNAVIAIIAIMIMGEGLDRAGVLNLTANFVMRMARGMESRLGVVINLVASLFSAVIPSQALAALMIPVSSRLAARTGVPLSRLLLPMAFCILTATNTTLIANSPLIVLNDLIASANVNLPPGAHTIPKFGLFSVTPIGLTLALLGVGYFYFFGRKLLPGHEDERLKVTPGRTESYFAETYGIVGETAELTVTAESPLVGMSIGEVEQLHGAPLILAIRSGNDARMAPPADHVIWVGSVLGVLGPREQLNQFANNQLCRLSTRMRQLGELFNPTRAGISEVVIPPVSRFIRHTVGELRLRKRFGISVLAVNRGDQVFRDDVRAVSLRAGDTVVLHSNWRDLSLAAEDRDLVVVTDIPKEQQRPGKIWQAVGFFVLAKCLALFTNLDLSVAMMTGAIGMLLSGVLNMDEAYKAINWKTIFVTACLIPLGWSMDATGTAAWIAQVVLDHLGSASPWLLQLCLAVLTLLFSQVMSNVGATVMMVPIAISVAVATGGNPSAYALIVAVSSSNTFLLSSGHPALMMVTGPGGYKGKDFLRVGLPLTLLVLIATLVAINLLFH